MTSYHVYRNGGGSIEARIKLACQLFYQDRRMLPAAIVVNKTERAEAKAACKALALKVPVASSGGCLVPEVWLELPQQDAEALHNKSA